MQFHGASSPTIPISAAIARTLRDSSYGARRPSHGTATGTGATAPGSGDSMTTTARRTMRCVGYGTRMGAPVDASAVSCRSNRLVGRIYEDQGSRQEDTRWSWSFDRTVHLLLHALLTWRRREREMAQFEIILTKGLMWTVASSSLCRRRGSFWPLTAWAQQGGRGGPTPSPQGAAVHFVGLNDGAKVPTKVTIRFGLRDMGVAPAGLRSGPTQVITTC